MKKFLLSLFVLFVSFIGFSNAGSYIFTGHFDGNLGNNQLLFGMNIPNKYYSCDLSVTCEFTNVSSFVLGRFVGRWINQDWGQAGAVFYGDEEYFYGHKTMTFTPSFSNCYNIASINFQSTDNNGNLTLDYSCVISGSSIIDNSSSSFQYTSMECQEVYSLIPLSSIDQEYCLGNNLCPEILTGDIENGSGEDEDLQWSALFINNVQHLGKSIINVSIPDYIYWDYYTDDEVFDLYIGSGYDQNYIDGVISINSYRPTTEDFTDIFTNGFILIFPYIVIVLFILYIWKLIIRIFK